MTRKRWLALFAVVAVLGGSFVLVGEYRALAAVQRYNDAILKGALEQAAVDGSDYGRFAQALSLQRGRDYQAALELYSGLLNTRHAALRPLVRFNTGTLYLEWALDSRAQGREDLARPLLELAKETYRELLTWDNHLWSARYNLELVLRLAPESAERDPDPQGMPEHSPEALGQVETHRQLP